MDTFQKLIHAHSEAARYTELAVFAAMHAGVLRGLYSDISTSDLLWAEVAQSEHILDPELAGYVTQKMAMHLHPETPWRVAVASTRTFYENVVDIAPWARRQWIDFADSAWYEEHEHDWGTAHGIPSLILCLPSKGDRVAAFRAFLRTIEAMLRHRDPNSGFWWLISDSLPDAELAQSLADSRRAAAETEVKRLRARLR